MAKLKVTQVKVSGLATNPDRYALPAGSCAQAMNVVIRRPGAIEPLTADRVVIDFNTFGDYRPVKLLKDPFYGRVAVVEVERDQANLWDPFADETQTGAINTFLINSDASVVTSTAIFDVVIGYWYGDGINELTRDIGFIPGMTQTDYATFRTLVTEKWAVLVNFERYSGLAPPVFKIVTSNVDDGWLQAATPLENGGTVSYIGVYSFESRSNVLTGTPAYVVRGPPSAVMSVTNFIEQPGKTTIYWLPPLNEAFQVEATTDYYLELYRCPQGIVDNPTQLTADYRMVAKLKIPKVVIPSFYPSWDSLIWDDRITEDSRDGGEELYVNPGQQGAQAANYSPPNSADVAVYKDTVFYANRQSLPSVVFKVRGAFGALLTEREIEDGIGGRLVSVAGTTAGVPGFTVASAEEFGALKIGMLIPPCSAFHQGTQIVDLNSATQYVTTLDDADETDLAASFTAEDMMKVWLYYADGGAPDIFEFIVRNPEEKMQYDNDQYPGGFRVIHPGHVLDSYPPQEGYELNLIHTLPGRRRVRNMYVSMTNAQNYLPEGAEWGDVEDETIPPYEVVMDTRRNVAWYSKPSIPEAVPLGNSVIIGSGVILKMWATVSALFFLCSDGLYRLSGPGAPWQVDQVDPTIRVLHPDLVAGLNNRIFAVLEDGIAELGEDGSNTISTDALGQRLREELAQMIPAGESFIQSKVPYWFGPHMAADQAFNEIWTTLNFLSGAEGTSLLRACYLYNDATQSFTETDSFYQSIAYYPNRQRMTYVKETETGFQLIVKEDFVAAAQGEYSYMESIVEFNPLVSEDQGNLKQWMDVNLFVNAGQGLGPGGLQDDLIGFFTLWNGEERVMEPLVLAAFPSMHFWVPRKYVLNLSLEDFGVRSSTTGYYILTGFAVRYRVASDTLKRN